MTTPRSLRCNNDDDATTTQFQRFNFPTSFTKIGSPHPIHILHRVSQGWPSNHENFVKIWHMVVNAVGRISAEPIDHSSFSSVGSLFHAQPNSWNVIERYSKLSINITAGNPAVRFFDTEPVKRTERPIFIYRLLRRYDHCFYSKAPVTHYCNCNCIWGTCIALASQSVSWCP